jgi:hypothetical protein
MTDVHYAHIVVYDDRPDDAIAVAKSIATFMTDKRLPARVVPVSTEEEVRVALAEHADLWICDVSLDGNDDDTLGLEFIDKHKPKFPHVAFGIMTSNPDLLERLGEAKHYPDFFFSKALIAPKVDSKFGEQVLSTILTHTRQNRAFQLSIQQPVESALKHALGWQKFNRPIVECLIRQVFLSSLAEGQHLGMVGVGDDSLNVAEPVFDRVDVELLPGSEGRSGSAVVKATPSMAGKKHKVSVVLKFCDLKSFSQELHHFSRFVKWTLPFSWRVDLLGTGLVGKLGLIAYSLAFEGASDAVPLSQAIAAGKTQPVEHLLATIFNHRQQIWYSTLGDRSESLGSDLAKRYFEGVQNLMSSSTNAFKAIGASKVYRSWPRIAEADIVKLRRECGRLTMPERPYKICICHGDLHGGNVMMSPSGTSMVFIDFQETGFQHVFTDFVFVENAIRKDGRYIWPKPEFLVEWEIAMAEAALAGTPVGTQFGRQRFLTFPGMSRAQTPIFSTVYCSPLRC